MGQNLLGFDVYIWDILCRLAGALPCHFYIDRILDTRTLATAWKEGLKKPRTGSMIDWQYKILNDRSLKARVGLATLLKGLGVDHDPEMLHNSLYDVEMTWEVFKKLKKLLDL